MDIRYDKLPSIEKISALIQRGSLEELRRLLVNNHPSDIADLLEELPPAQAVQAFELLPEFEASEVLDEANSTLTFVLVDKVDDEKLADLLDTLPMDDAAELLEDLPDETSDRLMGLMDPEERRKVRAILSYPESSAGRLMTRDVAALRAQWTISQALDYLRALADTETLHYLYVVDVVGHLTGVVPIRNLILAPEETLIKEVTIPDIFAVTADTDQEELADIISRYDYTAIPVVDDQGHLLGVVTVDDALDIIAEEITEDIQQLGGSSPLEQPYFSVSIGTMVRKRAGWLIFLFVASLLSSFVLAGFSKLISTFAILNIFIPLITGTGGNAGSQTVATVIRALAIGEVKFGDLGRTVKREMIVGLLMGVILGIVGFGYGLVIANGDVRVASVIALTLPAVVIWANTTATVIPILAERFKIDATVVSAPMITTIVDASGLLIYLGLATLFLS